MKVFFGAALDEMITELRGRAINNVRLHVMPKVEGKNLTMHTHVTTLCNEQIYESVVATRASLAEVAQDQVSKFVREKCEEARNKVAERLEEFEIRPGILQE